MDLGLALGTLLVVSFVTFAAIGIKSSDDVARGALGRQVTQEQLDAWVKDHGLDKSLPQRYGTWLGDFVQGDWGTSAVTGRPVKDDVLPRLKDTLILALIALLVALPFAIGMAVVMARRSGRSSGLALVVGTIALASFPEFVIAVSLMMLFAVKLSWLPVDSTGLTYGSTTDKVLAFVLPALTLVLAVFPHIARIARSAAVESFASPCVQAARLRGLSPRRVTWDYGMRNAAVPVVNAVAVNIVYLLGGVIIVENVFGFPGVGQLLVQAIGSGDALTVQAIALSLAGVFIGISLLADAFVLYFNPRLRTSTH